MCKIPEVTCRLCLAENLAAPFIDLRDDIVKAEVIRHVLPLKHSLSDVQNHPRHVCSTCTSIIDAFVELRDLALKNEVILYENKIKAELHENVEDKDSGEHYFKESIQEWEEELMETDDVLDSESIKDNVEETVILKYVKD